MKRTLAEEVTGRALDECAVARTLLEAKVENLRMMLRSIQDAEMESERARKRLREMVEDAITVAQRREKP